MNPETNPLDAYLERFLSLPFLELLRDYKESEQEIIDDLVLLVEDSLLRLGYEKHGEVFTSRDAHLRFLLGFLPNTRTLFLTLRDLVDEGPSTPHMETIEHFGLIRAVVVEVPNSIAPVLPDIGNAIRLQLIAAYTALEQAFVSNGAELERRVFRRIYDAIEAQLRFTGKHALFDRLWVFIGELDIGFYYFDSEVLRRVIDHYKSHQREAVSPAELTIWIMTAPLPFDKSLGIQAFEARKYLHLAWKNVDYIGDAPQIFEAEVALFGSGSFCSYTPCERRGFYLTIACPSESADHVMPQVQGISNLLCQYFEEGLKEWSPYVKVVKRVAEVVEGSSIAQLVGEVIGSAGATWFKKMQDP